MASIVCLTVLAAWTQCIADAAEDAATLEHGLKAAFLYKFAGYVDWPEDRFRNPDDPITIAVMDGEPIATELERMVVGRTAQGRPIKARRFKSGESLADVHILFVGSDDTDRLERMAEAARRYSILMVSDTDGGLARGSIINFVLADRRLRFEVALETAERNGLRLSSRLLAIALQVHTGAP